MTDMSLMDYVQSVEFAEELNKAKKFYRGETWHKKTHYKPAQRRSTSGSRDAPGRGASADERRAKSLSREQAESTTRDHQRQYDLLGIPTDSQVVPTQVSMALGKILRHFLVDTMRESRYNATVTNQGGVRSRKVMEVIKAWDMIFKSDPLAPEVNALSVQLPQATALRAILNDLMGRFYQLNILARNVEPTQVAHGDAFPYQRVPVGGPETGVPDNQTPPELLRNHSFVGGRLETDGDATPKARQCLA